MPKLKEESIAHRLSDDEILYDDPSALQVPTTADLRRMAGPLSTDEVTEVNRPRPGSRASIDERALPLPSIPDDEDMTMDTATSPQARAPLGGTLRMPAAPPPPPTRGLPDSLTTPTSPGPALGGARMTQPFGAPTPAAGPFGQPSTLISAPLGSAPLATAPMNEVPSATGGSSPGMPPPFGVPLGAPRTQESAQAAPAWAPPLGVATPGAASAFAQTPVIQQMPGGPATPLLVDVTPLTLTVETVQGFCDPVIGRNSPVPCERSRTFVTAADNQTTVRVRVAQGESKAFRENTLLGEVELSGLRPAPRGQVKIEVIFGLDTDGILNIRALDVATGHEARVVVRLVAVPDMGNVAEMASTSGGDADDVMNDGANLERLQEWNEVLDDSTYYEILGVLEICDDEALREAFRDFALTFHPESVPRRTRSHSGHGGPGLPTGHRGPSRARGS